MTIDDQKQQFSFAYARAVAAAAQVSVTELEVDDDSIDLLFCQRGGGGAVRSPRVEAQVKCTEIASLGAQNLAYPLPLRTA